MDQKMNILILHLHMVNKFGEKKIYFFERVRGGGYPNYFS